MENKIFGSITITTSIYQISKKINWTTIRSWNSLWDPGILHSPPHAYCVAFQNCKDLPAINTLVFEGVLWWGTVDMLCNITFLRVLMCDCCAYYNLFMANCIAAMQNHVCMRGFEIIHNVDVLSVKLSIAAICKINWHCNKSTLSYFDIITSLGMG